MKRLVMALAAVATVAGPMAPSMCSTMVVRSPCAPAEERPSTALQASAIRKRAIRNLTVHDRLADMVRCHLQGRSVPLSIPDHR